MAAGEGESIAKHSKHTITQETKPPPYVNWSTAMQAYYSSGVAPPFFASNVASSIPYPYIWGAQTPQKTEEMETKARNRKERTLKIKLKGALRKTKVVRVRSGAGVKMTLSSMNADTITQSVESENDGSSDAVVPNYDPAVPMPSIASILTMGIDLWNPSAENVSVETSPNLSGSSQTTIPNHRTRDGREQKRKLSNREAAIRSRQRKQEEWEEQQAEVYALSIENHTLKDEIRMLLEECNKLRSENDSIKDKINKICDEGKIKAVKVET